MNDLYQRGACVESGAHDLFFSERPEELARAQVICSRCPVRLSCLQAALQEELEWGVWGGVIFWEGQPYYRRRGRGRPRRDDEHRPLSANVDDLWSLVHSADALVG